MDYVIGDAKQAFIQNKLTNTSKVDNLLKGFKEMQCNGVRVPIFPTGLTPNVAMLEYFMEKATEMGFEIFANPEQGGGGSRVANESWTSGGVKDNPLKTQILIDRVLQFDKMYPCKWINPFNEDAKTGSMWLAEQMNTLYSSVKTNVVNAEVIGSWAWGLTASIDVFEKTNMKDYITDSTSHNLGFTHSKWAHFIEISHAAGLPVWDSEVNHSRKYADKSTRLEAAIQYGVDGLVLYNTWENIDLTSGVVNNGGYTMMSLYFKPVSLDNSKSLLGIADVYNEDNGFRVEFLTRSQNKSLNIMDISGKTIQQYSQIPNS